jgi:hypothetical protein
MNKLVIAVARVDRLISLRYAPPPSRASARSRPAPASPRSPAHGRRRRMVCALDRRPRAATVASIAEELVPGVVDVRGA